MDRKDLSSTEIYDGTDWSYAASLPSKRFQHVAVTLDNSVFVLGELIFWITDITNV